MHATINHVHEFFTDYKKAVKVSVARSFTYLMPNITWFVLENWKGSPARVYNYYRL